MTDRNQRNYPILLLAIGLLCLCQVQAQTTTGYNQQISEWHKQRVAELLAPDGWVNLVGLYWLEPGKNTFGSDTHNNLVFTQANMPSNAGYFLLQNEEVIWVSNPSVKVLAHNTQVDSLVIYQKNKEPLQLSLGSLRWTIIQRGDKVGIRLRDLATPALTEFTGIEHFPIAAKWRITAHLEPRTQASVSITNVLGQISEAESPGKLVFTLDGKEYSLDALQSGNQLFIVFGDATSGKESYAAGRFLETPLPDDNGNTILDFNKAYNPPCAFTRYATCPLPPKQNILPIAISAGEKDYTGIKEGEKNKKDS